MSTNRPLYGADNRAGRNCIGAPRNDTGLNAIGTPPLTDPGPSAAGAYDVTTATTVSLASTPVAEAVTFVYNIVDGLDIKFSMATVTPGATIYYTTDGSAPTDGSTEYTAAIVDDTEPVEADAAGFYFYRAIAYAPGVDPSAVSTAAGDDLLGAVDLVGGGLVTRNDVHSCPGVICSDDALTGVSMKRLWTVNGTIDLRDCALLGGFYLPVGVVTGNILLNNSGFAGSVLIDLFNLTTVNTVDLGGSTFTDLELSNLDTGAVTAVNATLLETVSLTSLRVGSVTLTGCALIESIVDTIFNDIANQVLDAGFAVTAIDLSGGTSAAPTAASLAARTALAGAGTVITTN